MSNTNKMPREEGTDHSLSLLREGYLYILNRRHSFNSDVFETRLLGKKAICMGGKEAAEIFYDAEKFKRKGAAPNRVMQTLFGKNGVQTLDGQAHQNRKEMFMSVMTPNRLEELKEFARDQWEEALDKWGQMQQVILYEEAQEMLCRIACHWAGVPVHEENIQRLTKELVAMFETPAKVGPKHWFGRNARNRVEAWMGELVEGVRNREVHPPENSPLHIFSWHRDTKGNLLEIPTVAVEVINILRPIVAIAIFITFITVALHHYPSEREKLKIGDEKYLQMFVQEVRRFYPFFPFVTAKVKTDFSWNGYEFERGTLTLLDLYGTNHDPRLWDHPEEFKPERFANWDGNPFGFIPQGGGEYLLGHRCAGEWVTIEMMKVSIDYLVNQINYEVPDQDLSFSFVRIPSIPKSKVVIQNIKRTN